MSAPSPAWGVSPTGFTCCPGRQASSRLRQSAHEERIRFLSQGGRPRGTQPSVGDPCIVSLWGVHSDIEQNPGTETLVARADWAISGFPQASELTLSLGAFLCLDHSLGAHYLLNKSLSNKTPSPKSQPYTLLLICLPAQGKYSLQNLLEVFVLWLLCPSLVSRQSVSNNSQSSEECHPG